MLNLVVEEEGYPAAVLIRGAGKFVGPGRLTKGLGIDKNLNSKELNKKNGLWIEDRGVIVRPRDILCTPRIGVEYAGVWAKRPWRFVLKSRHMTNPR